MSRDACKRRVRTFWRRLRHRLYRERPGWRRSPWPGGHRYWYEPDDGWPEGPTRRRGGEGVMRKGDE